MTTERDEWRPRYNENSNDEGYNRERRPYQSNPRSNNNYGRQEGRGNYNRQNSNYDRQGGSSYDRQGSYGYDRQGGGSGNYNRPRNNNYDRQQGGYDRPQGGGGYQNNYENRPYNSRPYRQSDASNMESNDLQKKRRPRVGERTSQPIQRPSGGGYNNNREGGGYNDNRNSYGNRNNSQRPRLERRDNRGGGGGGYNPNAKYGLQKQLKYREENFDPNELIRLNKYLANAGVCSRREADDFIQAGLVKVNDVVVTELGTKVKRMDEVKFHDQAIKLEHKIYVLLNKPKNCVTTADDPQERLTVMDLVKSACHERIFPVGRLDRNTTGVLLLTNDGDLASKLTHPKYLKKKIYHVWLDKPVSMDDMQKMVDGLDLEDGEIHADAISYVSDEDKDQVGIEIHSGRNRIVRRMFESLGYHVIKLDRVYFAGLTKKNLKRGKWRYLSDKEVSMLRMGAFE